MATHHFRDAITPLLLRSTGDAVVDAVHRIGRAVADARPQDRWSVMTPAVALGFFAMVVAAVVIVSLFVA